MPLWSFVCDPRKNRKYEARKKIPKRTVATMLFLCCSVTRFMNRQLRRRLMQHPKAGCGEGRLLLIHLRSFSMNMGLSPSHCVVVHCVVGLFVFVMLTVSEERLDAWLMPLMDVFCFLCGGWFTCCEKDTVIANMGNR